MAYDPTLDGHPGGGNAYTVTVRGDALNVPDGTTAIRTAPLTYTLPYKKAPAGNTDFLHRFTLPLVCTGSANLDAITLNAVSGGRRIGGGNVTVHDAV
ncbi:MAG: hypothetical protein ABI599_01130 [Flavobacteriales bacterium]